ncbi:MAG: DUF962 domain-containing protein [Thiomonas sp.]
MNPATFQLINYARYHRDQRNIATHFVGIPLIVFGVAVLLGRLPLGPSPLTAAWLVWALAAVWYLRLRCPAVTLPTLVALAAIIAVAQPLAALNTGPWLVWGLGSFVVGWVLQTIGHVWEGRKPAFFDDLRGLLAGPMFVVAEALFAAGLLRPLHDAITSAAGPVRRRRNVHPVSRG